MTTMNHAFDDSSFYTYTKSWPELEAGLLDEARGNLPGFPLFLLPEEWRQWVEDTAQSAGTAPDYVAQGLLAAVAAICGSGVRVRVTPSWHESLVLWLALVGSPSSGKSPALSSVREQLGAIEDELREQDGQRRAEHASKAERARIATDRWKKQCEDANDDNVPVPPRPLECNFDQPFVPSQIVVADATMEALADVVAGNPRGVILWRDELTAWLANLGRYASGGSDRAHWLEAWAAAGITVNRRSRTQPLHLPKFPVSVVGSIQPDRLAEAFQGSDDGMAARFLYAWPEVPKYISLKDRRIARDDTALAMLQAIARAAGTAEQPLVMGLDDAAFDHFDGFLGGLSEDAAAAHGLEEGWIGKGRGTVARLAGVLALLRWSENGLQEAPRTVTQEDVENAIALWAEYFRAHARTIFSQAGKIDHDRDARRVVKWLRRQRSTQISREDIRRGAMVQSISAEKADILIARLEKAGVLRPAPAEFTGRRGRPAKRWDVNPELHES